MRYFKGNRAANPNKIPVMDGKNTGKVEPWPGYRAALLVSCLLLSPALSAQDDPRYFESDEEIEQTEDPEVDDCDWYLENQPVQEQSQEVLRSWSCHTFRWFDGPPAEDGVFVVADGEVIGRDAPVLTPA